MKKIIMSFTLVLALFTLASCVEEPMVEEINESPVFGAVDDLTLTVGDSIDLYAGMTASDPEDGDVSDNIKVTNSRDLPLLGTTVTSAGTFTIDYYVFDSKGADNIYERQLTVVEIVVDLGNCVSDIPGMVLTFCDDFSEAENADDTGLDMDKWGYQLGDGSEYGIPGWGNNEQEYYKEENSYVSEGNLYIQAKLEEYGGKTYTSSKIVTDQKFSQTFGRFEAKIMLPLGDGLWPAFWMMPQDSVYGGWARSGEIDIMEAKGRLPYHASGAIHYGSNWPNNVYQHGSIELAEGEGIDTFHVYAVEWTSTSITWYVDDEVMWEATDWYSKDNEFPAPFDQDFYLILNLAVGGNFDGNILPDDSIFDEDVLMIVDYVRVFQYE